MLCGHCGTKINEGFTVCPSCGAAYRRSPKAIQAGLWGVLIFGTLLGVVLFSGATVRGNGDWAIAIGIVGCFAASLYSLSRGSKKRWYR